MDFGIFTMVPTWVLVYARPVVHYPPAHLQDNNLHKTYTVMTYIGGH